MSNADKRTVATDALETLGMIINSGGRDAIHLAVEPVVAGCVLRPGDHVGLVDGKAVPCSNPLGIVDPFLPGMVQPGQMFWLVVYPRQITSLRHVWTHPAFPAEGEAAAAGASQESDEVAASRKWIDDFALSVRLRYDDVMDGARDYVADRRSGGYGEYLCFGGLLEGESVPEEFWSHYERVTGERVAEDHRGSFFTCSC